MFSLTLEKQDRREKRNILFQPSAQLNFLYAMNETSHLETMTTSYKKTSAFNRVTENILGIPCYIYELLYNYPYKLP
jgi:hypothetical protein